MTRPQKRSCVIETSAQSSESARRVPTFVRRSFVILISYFCVFNLFKCVSAIQKGMIFVSVRYYVHFITYYKLCAGTATGIYCCKGRLEIVST